MSTFVKREFQDTETPQERRARLQQILASGQENGAAISDRRRAEVQRALAAYGPDPSATPAFRKLTEGTQDAPMRGASRGATLDELEFANRGIRLRQEHEKLRASGLKTAQDQQRYRQIDAVLRNEYQYAATLDPEGDIRMAQLRRTPGAVLPENELSAAIDAYAQLGQRPPDTVRAATQQANQQARRMGDELNTAPAQRSGVPGWARTAAAALAPPIIGVGMQAAEYAPVNRPDVMTGLGSASEGTTAALTLGAVRPNFGGERLDLYPEGPAVPDVFGGTGFTDFRKATGLSAPTVAEIGANVGLMALTSGVAAPANAGRLAPVLTPLSNTRAGMALSRGAQAMEKLPPAVRNAAINEGFNLAYGGGTALGETLGTADTLPTNWWDYYPEARTREEAQQQHRAGAGSRFVQQQIASAPGTIASGAASGLIQGRVARMTPNMAPATRQIVNAAVGGGTNLLEDVGQQGGFNAPTAGLALTTGLASGLFGANAPNAPTLEPPAMPRTPQTPRIKAVRKPNPRTMPKPPARPKMQAPTMPAPEVPMPLAPPEMPAAATGQRPRIKATREVNQRRTPRPLRSSTPTAPEAVPESAPTPEPFTPNPNIAFTSGGRTAQEAVAEGFAVYRGREYPARDLGNGWVHLDASGDGSSLITARENAVQWTSRAPMGEGMSTEADVPASPRVDIEGVQGEATGRVVPMDPREIAADPERFQYKAEAFGKGGTTPLLRGVQQWDPYKGGVLQVWRDPADGQVYVVNGHHRLELAQRVGAQEVNVQFIDAANAKDARIRGALTNIAEGRGTPVDAAKVFRDGGMTRADLEGEGVSLRESVAQQGLALSNLSPELFGMVARGDMPVSRGVVIGDNLPDHTQQRALVRMLDKKTRGGAKVSDDTVAELIRLAKGGETRTEVEPDLFGGMAVERSNAVERAELSAYLRGKLKEDKQLFGFVSRGGRAEKLARDGNTIDADQSRQIAQQAEQALGVYDRLSTMRGPLADALNQAATEIATRPRSEHNAIRQRLYDAAIGAVRAELTGQSARPVSPRTDAERESATGGGERGPVRPDAGAGDLFGERPAEPVAPKSQKPATAEKTAPVARTATEGPNAPEAGAGRKGAKPAAKTPDLADGLTVRKNGPRNVFVASDGREFTGINSRQYATKYQEALRLVGKRVRSYGGGVDVVEGVAWNDEYKRITYTVRDEATGRTRQHTTIIEPKQVLGDAQPAVKDQGTSAARGLLDDFYGEMTPQEQGKARKALDAVMPFRENGKVLRGTLREAIEDKVREGWRVVLTKSGPAFVDRDMSGWDKSDIGEYGMQYASYLSFKATDASTAKSSQSSAKDQGTSEAPARKAQIAPKPIQKYPGGDEVLELNDLAAASGLYDDISADQRKVLDSINGKRTLDQIIARNGGDNVFVDRIVRWLKEKGYVDVVKASAKDEGTSAASPRVDITEEATAARKDWMSTLEESERADVQAALERLRKPLTGSVGQLKPGQGGESLPQRLRDYATVGSALIKAGFRTFEAWAAEMTTTFGDGVKPDLQRVYDRSVTLARAKQYAGSINTEKLDTPDAVIDFIRQEVEARTEAITTQRRGRMSVDETKAAARKMNVPWKKLQQIAPGTAFNAEQITYLRELHLGMAEEVATAARAFDRLPSEENRLRAMAAKAKFDAVLLVLQGASTEAGRALRIHREFASALRGKGLVNALTGETVKPADDPDAADQGAKLRKEAIKRTLKEVGEGETFDDFMEEMSQIIDDDPERIAKLVQKYSQRAPHWIHQYITANLLSGPSGAITDVTSTGVFQAVERLVQRPARKALMGQWAEATPKFEGFMAGLQAGIRDAGSILQQGYTRAMAERLELYPELPGGAKNPWNLVPRARAALNAVQYDIAFSYGLHDMAREIATAEGLTGEAKVARARELVADPTEDMVIAANEYAGYMTFTDRGSKLARNLEGLRNYMIPADVAVVGRVQPLRILMPFLRTGLRIFSRGVEASPLGFANLLSKEVHDGPAEVKARIIANASMSTLALAGLIPLAMAGRLTAAAPKDKRERDLFYAKGKQPYSVQVGDRWISYRGWASQWYILLSIAASFGERDAVVDDNQAMRTAMSVTEAGFDLSMMQGLRDFDQALNDPAKMDRFGASVASQFVPFGSLLRNVEAATDPTMRVTERSETNPLVGIEQNLRSKYPIVSGTLPPRVDALGATVTNQGGLWAFTPFRVRQAVTDDLVTELARLKWYPGTTSRTVTRGGVDRQLSTREYAELLTKAGVAARYAIQQAMQDPDYATSTDEEKRELLEAAVRESRSDARKEFLGEPTSTGGARRLGGQSRGGGSGFRRAR